jgi:rhamnose transport system permease protein
MKTHWRQWWVAFALTLLLGYLALRAPAFFHAGQLLTMLTGAAPVLLAAAGVALVIVARQIDISIGSQFSWCSVLAGLAAAAGWPMPAVAAVALGAGALLGAFNGMLVCGLGLPSIVVTLATMVTWREALRWWREGEFIRDLPPGFQWFGLSQGGGQAVLLALSLGLFVLLALATRFLRGARFIYAAGSDADAARLAGLRPRTTGFSVFVLAGALTGMAALLNAVRFADIDPKTGTGLEMQAIAAAVVGGVSISGGRGSLWGVLAGVLLLACIAPALVFLHIPPQWERAIQGAIILFAVAAEGWKPRAESGL